MVKKFNPLTPPFDLTLGIGDTIPGSPTANGLLFSEAGLLTNDRVTVTEGTYFGAVPYVALGSPTVANTLLHWLDVTAFGVGSGYFMGLPDTAAIWQVGRTSALNSYLRLLVDAGGDSSFGVQPNGTDSALLIDGTSAALTVPLDMDTNKITSVDTPTAGGDAVNKTYADGLVSDTVYGAGWNGVTGIAPSKNAVYDKIEALGSGTPGGSDTEIQYNNGGAFGGDSDLWWDDTADAKKLVVRRDSSSQTSPIFHIVKDTNSQTLLSFGTANASFSSQLQWFGPGGSHAVLFEATQGMTSGFNIAGGNSGLYWYATAQSVTLGGLMDDGKIALGKWDFASFRGWNNFYGGDSGTVSAAVVNAASQSVDSFRVTSSSGATQFAVAKNGAIKPPSLADSAAENSTLYYSTDASKLVWKDSGGSVNNLY